MCGTPLRRHTLEADLNEELDFHRDVWIWSWLQDAVQDVRYAARQVRRSPQLASAVDLTLVIGIGLNAVAFSAFNGILFRAQVTRDPLLLLRRIALSRAIATASGMARPPRAPCSCTRHSEMTLERSPQLPQASGPHSGFGTPSSRRPFEASSCPATTSQPTWVQCFLVADLSRMTAPLQEGNPRPSLAKRDGTHVSSVTRQSWVAPFSWITSSSP